MNTVSADSKLPRVVILGGGVAALETMLALRALAPDRLDVTLCAPRSDFVYRPYAVAEPFGVGEVLHFDLGDLASRCGATFIANSAVEVRAPQGRVILREDQELPFDFLVLAYGTKSVGAIPGALEFWGVSDDPGVEDIVGDLERGEIRRVVFTAPGGPGWPFPIYELPLLLRTHLEATGVKGVELTIVTAEEAPLQLFGKRASGAVSALLAERNIKVVTATRPVKFDGGTLSIVPGGPIETDRVLALPRLEGRRLLGVPVDDSGFVRVDPHGRVAELDRVFAAGDLVDFPVKQGGLAAEQADAVAESIAAEAGVDVDPQPFEPILRGMLLTGESPKFMSSNLTGGKGETSILSDEALWWPPGKIAGRYLAPFLADVSGSDVQPPQPATLSPVEIDLGASRAALAAIDPSRVASLRSDPQSKE